MQKYLFWGINNRELLMFSSKYFRLVLKCVCGEFFFCFDRLHFLASLHVTNTGMRFRTFVAARSAKTQL